MLLIQNWFEIFNKSKTSMKSCKLDKNRINYVSGLYIVYYNYNNLHCVKVSYCIAKLFLRYSYGTNKWCTHEILCDELTVVCI